LKAPTLIVLVSQGEGSRTFRNVGILPHHYTASHPGMPLIVWQ